MAKVGGFLRVVAVLWVCVGWGLAAFVASAQADTPPFSGERVRDTVSGDSVPVLNIPMLATAPVIDGALDDAAWSSAARVQEFWVPVTGRAGAPPTTMWLALDDDYLYLAARCTLSSRVEPPTVIITHDGPVWEDGSVELFIQTHGERLQYYQVAVNSIGIALDYLATVDPVTHQMVKLSGAWQPALVVATGREANAWTVEMTLPLTSIGLTPEGTKVIRLNLCRNDGIAPEQLRSWAFMPGLTYHDITHFGVGRCHFPPPPNQTTDPRRDLREAGGSPKN